MEVLAEFDIRIEHIEESLYGTANVENVTSANGARGLRRGMEVLVTWERQVQGSDLSSETTGEEIEDLQTQPVTGLGKIQTYVCAGTVPDEREYNTLASLVSKMRLQNSLLQVRMVMCDREIWIALCPQPLRCLLLWETHRMHHTGGARTLRRILLD